MNPLSIKGILAQYASRFRAPEGVVVKEIVVLYGERGIVCDGADFSYSPQTRVVMVRARGPKKAEILIHKSEILFQLKEKLPHKDMPHDIL